MKLRGAQPPVFRHAEGAQAIWRFQYWHEELLPNGLVRSTRRFEPVGDADGPNALTRAQAEKERDRFMAELRATPVREKPIDFQHVNAGDILFGQLAEIWERDYVERLVGGKPLIAASTRGKYQNHLHNHVLPRWADTPIGQFRAKQVLDWLQTESGSWFMMTDLRNIMSGIFTRAQDWEIVPDTFANPIARVKLPKKWQVYEKRILSEEETVRVLERLKDPYRLICEICVATGARISEVIGLQLKHVNLEKAFVRIEQRHWRGDIDEPKTERSKRTLTLGGLAQRVREWIEFLPKATASAWLFPQDDLRHPIWDSGVRKYLKQAAKAEHCDFHGFGPHSLRRANITWRQEVGGSSIEASRIAGHANTKITEQYTVVQLNRQEELTRRIQAKLVGAGGTPLPEAVLPEPVVPEPIVSEPIRDEQDLVPEVEKGLASHPLQSHECDPERSHPMATKTVKNQKRKKASEIEVREGSKKAKVIQMLQRPDGATLEGLMKATGWQAHSVRGFLSAALTKKLGLNVDSSKREDGQRVYRIA